MYVGATVTFKGRRNQILEGKITKINNKSIKVDCGINGNWRVSPTLLTLV